MSDVSTPQSEPLGEVYWEDDIGDLRQMASAPSDAFTAGAWCQAVNESLEMIDRLVEQLETAEKTYEHAVQMTVEQVDRADALQEQLETARDRLGVAENLIGRAFPMCHANYAKRRGSVVRPLYDEIAAFLDSNPPPRLNLGLQDDWLDPTEPTSVGRKAPNPAKERP